MKHQSTNEFKIMIYATKKGKYNDTLKNKTQH